MNRQFSSIFIHFHPFSIAVLVYWRLFTFQKNGDALNGALPPPLEYLPTSQALQKQQCWHVAPEFLHGVMAETGGCWQLLARVQIEWLWMAKESSVSHKMVKIEG
jgi:hypothetical protein